MKQRKKYFVLNKLADFQKGRTEGMIADAKGLHLKEGETEGVYYSRVFDSRDKQTIWQRFCMEGDFGLEESIELTIYGTENRKILVKGQLIDVEDLIRDEEFTEKELRQHMEPWRQAGFIGFKDVLLHQVKGRYLWFRIILKETRGKKPWVRQIKISFPKNTWLKYLPEIYEQDEKSASFLERYLGIFQSIYEDMTDKIEELPFLLNPWAAASEQLQWMSQWLAVENQELWTQGQLRFLLANGVRLYQYRGTVGYMKEILRLYTGKEPYIIEYHQLEPFFDGSTIKKQLTDLYGKEACEFTVLLAGERLEGKEQESMIRQIIDMTKPATMECRIVILKPYIFLGQYSYLGINSVLGQYKAFELNGLCTLPFSAIVDKDHN